MAARTGSRCSSRASTSIRCCRAGRLHLDHDLQRVLAGDRRGHHPEELITFKYEDQGVATLEDGLYVTEDKLDDPEEVDKLARFVRASMKGWKWAEENPDEAAMIVLENDATGAQTEKHQKRMMREIAKLTEGSNGELDPADFERTVESLLSGGSDPVITEHPGDGAWTHAVTDKALN